LDILKNGEKFRAVDERRKFLKKNLDFSGHISGPVHAPSRVSAVLFVLSYLYHSLGSAVSWSSHYCQFIYGPCCELVGAWSSSTAKDLKNQVIQWVHVF